jgi:hypothetical protein
MAASVPRHTIDGYHAHDRASRASHARPRNLAGTDKGRANVIHTDRERNDPLASLRPAMMRTMRFVLLLSIVITGCGGAPAAAVNPPPPRAVSDGPAYFTALEERLRNAEEITLDVEIENGAANAPRRLRAQVTRDRLAWQLTFHRDGADVEATMESDGSTARFHDGSTGRDTEQPARDDLRELFTLGLALGGAQSAVMVTAAPDVITMSDGEECCFVELERANVGTPEEMDGVTATPLHVRLTRFGQDSDTGTVWIDPASDLPIRRDIRTRDQGEPRHVIEHYRTFAVRP